MTPKESRVDRALSVLLRPFAKVEPAEALTAVVMTLTVFLLLTAYYLLKTAREPLILLHGGAEVKSYAAAGQAVLLLGFVQLYGWVARKVGRMRLLLGVYLFFAANLVLFATLASAGVKVAVPFYLWVGVYNYTSIAQFWGYASDVYTPDQGKRLFSVIGVGSSIGAVAGARLAKVMIPLGPRALMLGAAILLGVCCGLLIWVNARVDGPVAGQAKKEDAEPLSHESAFSLLTRDKYLILIALLTLLINWCNSTGEYILDRTLLAAVAAKDQHADPMVFVGQFKAEYFEWVNIAGVLLQLFAVSRILDKLGVRTALLFLPVVAFGGYTMMLIAPVLSLIRLAKVAENSIDYSVQNTARQALYLVATRVEKYVGKIAVDSFFVRFGDVLSAVVVYIGAKLALPTQVFAAINLALIVAWILIVVLVGREHRRRSEDLEKENAPGHSRMNPATS
ncbi:MAG TPA: Npt1/Npt2 family nucleotide transporter [Polyangiaceae bacterium]|nr:Npt1/Npt2 family nucleotide transporter [Polyangiaceae bacterium]